MTIEQKAREIGLDVVGYDETKYHFSDIKEAARLGIIEGHFIAARLLQEAGEFDAEIVVRRAIERALIEEQKP